MTQDWLENAVLEPADAAPDEPTDTSPDWLKNAALEPAESEQSGDDWMADADLAPVEEEQPTPEPTEPSRDELERMARTARMTGDLGTLKEIQSQIEGMDQSGGYDVREEFDTPAARLALGVGDTVAGAYQQTKSAFQGAVGGQLRAAGEAIEENTLFDMISRYRSAAERYQENGGDLNDAIQGSESEIANALTGSAESVRLAQELSEQKVEEYRPENMVGAFLYDATGALAYMGPAMAATYLTRNPNAGPAAMFGMIGADEYNRQRTDGVEKTEAAQRAVLAGSYEAVPEHLFGVFGRFLKGKQSDRLIQALAEGGAEATTFVAERLDSILRDESEYRGFWSELTDGLRAFGIGATVGGVMPIGTRREDPLKRAYQDSAASEDARVKELTEQERAAYKKYDEAKGPTAKGPAFKEWWAVRRQRQKAEEQARDKAGKKYDKKVRKPDEPARTESQDDVTLDDIQLVEGVESAAETDLLNPEAEQEAPAAEEQAPEQPQTPDFTSATFTPLQAARELPPEPAADAQPEDFRPVVDDNADPATSTTFAETIRSDIDGLPASYGMAFPGNLQVDAETYQYKQTDDPEGRTDRFTGDEKWDPSSAGTVIIHRREDGDYVADGHQRAGLARARREAGENPANLFSQAIILNEADGWTPQDVRLVAAFKNVRQETGTAIDAAKLLREGGDAVMDALGESINPKRSMWRDAQGLAGLADPIFQEVVNGVVPIDRGAIIGQYVTDPAKQRAALQYFQENPPSTQYEAEIIARDINRLEAQEQTQGGLDFGDAVANVPIKERAKILDAARKLMNTRKKVFRQLVKDQAMIEGEAGNVLDEQGNVKIAQDAETVMEVLNRMVDTNAELNEVLNNAAAQLANGDTTASNAARELVSRSEEFAASVLRGREDREGQREPAGAQEPGQREEQEAPGAVRPEADESTQESLIPDAQAERTETQEAAEPEAEAPTEAAPVETEPAPTEEAPDATQESTQDEKAAERPEAEGRPAARPERTERPASPEGGRTDGATTGTVGGRSPGPEGVRPPLRVASEERIPEPRVYVDADQYQAGLDDNQRLAVNLALDRFSQGGQGFMLADGTGVGKTRQILATADQYQQRFDKPVLVVTQNKQIIKGSFTDDARSMGIDLGGIELATYDDVRAGKVRESEYGLIIFDEAHNLKNFDSAKTIASNNLKADHRMFATATPMDSVSGAVYFMSEITGKKESAIYEQIGLVVRDRPNPDTGKMETVVQLAEGYQWSSIVQNLIALRNEAVEQGAMVRREYPFYGEITTQDFTLPRSQIETQSKIEDYWDDQIANASNPAQRRNLAGQKLGELSRWVEAQKVEEAFNLIQQKLNEGRSVVLVAEGVNDTNIKALGERFDGALSALSARLDAAGIDHAKIYGSGPKDAAVDAFQSGQVRVALATPKSGGTGINLDDTVGDRPRTLVTLTANYAGDTFEQILGRVSRRNTASPAEAIGLVSPDSISDARRSQILGRKMQALRAVQVGDDLDAATVGLPEDGATDVRLSAEGRAEGEAWSTEEVQSALEEMTAGWSVQPPMNVVKSEAELPDGIKLSIYHMNAQGRVRGVMAGGEIWVIADNVTERAEVERVLFHEAKGHLGLRGLLGEDIYPVLDRVYAAYGRQNLKPWINAYVGEKKFDPKIQEHRWLVAEEKLASLAETDPESRWVKRAIGALREWLRRNTFLELSKLNESDMVHLLAKSSETLTRGLKPSEAGALPAWAQRDTIGGVRPTWGRFVEAIREWRVDQLRRFLKAVDPETNVADMKRPELERQARIYANFSGVAEAPVPQSAWEALQGQDIRLSKLEEDQPSLFGEEVQSEAERKRKLQQRKEEVERKLGTDRHVDAADGDGDLFGGRGDDQQPLFSLVDADTKLAEKDPNIVQRGIVGTLRAVGTVPSAVNSTLDMMVRTPFAIVGGLDPIGRWKPGVAARDAVANALTEWKPKGESAPFKFVGYSLDFFRSKLVDRWNQTDTQRAISRKADKEKNAILRFMGKVIQRLEMEGLSNSDLITLTNILEGKQVSDKRLNQLATPIRKTIDELGMELVRLGLLEKATWQKGVGKYLHRSYEKYERELSGIRNLPGIAQSFATRGFNKRIKGDELRARGIIEKVTQGRLQRNLPPQWWKKKVARSGNADKALKGTRWVILDKIVAVGEKNESLPIEDAGETKRVRKDRVYWPADEAIPDTYAGWENQGEFEVLGVKGQKITLRRDYTDAEMEAMGRVMDARFNIIRTFQLLADDISTGRFFEDIAKSELSTTLDQVDQRLEKVVNTKSRIPPNLLTADWVEVPTDKIFPGSRANQYGALGGRLVRPEVWREINQMDKAARKGPWLTLLRHWKANKTIRNPVVHMNNVMSNLVLLDLQDVDVNHLTRAMHELIHGGPIHQEAAENNAYSGIFVQNELNRTVMKPVMDEMVREIKTRDADSPQGQARIISTMKLATLRTVQGLKWVDQKAFNAYEMEDVVFRLATYMKYRERGLSQAEAAQLSVDAFLNYDIQAPWVNAARNSVMPFLAYSYRAIPTVGSALIHRPWKFAKYVALMELWNQFAFWFDDEGDEDLERATMRDQLQGMTWMSIPGTDIGLDRMVRHPWRDKDGQPLYQDVYRWIPVGDVMDTDQGILGIPAWANPTGPMLSAFEMILNKQAFTGQEIFSEDLAELEGSALVNLLKGNVTEKTEALMDYAWKTYAPGAAFVPGTWHFDKITSAAQGAKDPLGRAYSLPTALASSVGVKVQPHDPELGLEYKARHFERMAEAIDFTIWEAEKDYSRGFISEKVFNEKIEKAKERAKMLERSMEAFVEEAGLD